MPPHLRSRKSVLTCVSQQKEVIVTLREERRETDDDKRRFKVVFQYANTLDLDTIVQFCKGDRQNEVAKEMMVSRLCISSVIWLTSR